MASKKRGAEVQITKDTPEDDQPTETEAGVWKEASSEQLKQRKLIRVKKKKEDTEEESKAEEAPTEETQGESKPLPKFDFGVEEQQASSFDFEWKDQTDSSKASEVKESETSNSSESWQFRWGDSAGFGAFDASAFKSFGSVANEAGPDSGFSFGTESSTTSFIEPPPATPASHDVFKDSKPEKSGTEEDKTLLRVQSKVYVLKESPAEGGKSGEAGANKEDQSEVRFSETGHGDLHINIFSQDGLTRGRLVLRMEKTQRLVLNAPIFKDMQVTPQGDKFLRVISIDLDEKPKLYLLKFKTKQEQREANDKIEKVMKLLGTPFGTHAEDESSATSV